MNSLSEVDQSKQGIQFEQTISLLRGYRAYEYRELFSYFHSFYFSPPLRVCAYACARTSIHSVYHLNSTGCEIAVGKMKQNSFLFFFFFYFFFSSDGHILHRNWDSSVYAIDFDEIFVTIIRYL